VRRAGKGVEGIRHGGKAGSALRASRGAVSQHLSGDSMWNHSSCYSCHRTAGGVIVGDRVTSAASGIPGARHHRAAAASVNSHRERHLYRTRAFLVRYALQLNNR